MLGAQWTLVGQEIVGYHEFNYMAIIFPQIPGKGAKIAIERLNQFFHEKFREENVLLDQLSLQRRRYKLAALAVELLEK